VGLPPGCTFGVDCTSAVPLFYLGSSSVTMETCTGQNLGSHHGDHSWGRDGNDGEGNGCSVVFSGDLPMQYESAYLNPFGGPVLFESQGGEVMVVAAYSQAKIDWNGSQLGGVATGTLDGNAVFGGFSMTVNAHEDLVAGTESESGSIALVGMVPTSLNADGRFRGHSTFSPLGGIDCAASMGLPEGTCTLTGLSSSGSFSMHSDGGKIRGSYSTQWGTPAFAFSSTVSAAVGSGSDNGGD
jgi:hypothetical protein